MLTKDEKDAPDVAENYAANKTADTSDGGSSTAPSQVIVEQQKSVVRSTNIF